MSGYPDGLVSVTKEAGPLRIRGKFIDGTGKVETKTFPGPHVFIVEATGTGRVSLVSTPFGLKDGKEIDRRIVDVNGGTGPQPNPNPQPNPPPDPSAKVVSFVVAEDTSAAGQWRGDVLGNPKLASWYRATFGAGIHHRLVDVKAEGDDATAQTYRKLAAGKTLPYLWQLDAAGKVVKELVCPKDADAFIASFDAHAGPRALGAKLGKPKLKWAVFGESPKTPLIPRANWKPVDLRAYLPAVYDQNGRGQCASSSACSLYEWSRNLAGLPPVHVSAGDLYSRVNDGVDQGSFPEDNLKEMIDNGVLPVIASPYVWDGKRRSDAATVAARKKYRIDEAYLCDSFDALASAIQQGFAVQIAIWWYDGDSVDANGMLPKQGRGGRGGHALMAYGIVKLPDGSWAMLVRNSWGTGWGNSRDGSLGAGNCIIHESRFSFEFGSVWAVKSVYQSTSKAEPKRDPLRFLDRELAVLKP